MLRGEVWQINLDPTVGSELRKSRPAIIVNDDTVGILPLRIIVPLTDWKGRYAAATWMTRVESSKQNGLSKVSAADAFQVRSVSTQRFVRRLGQVEDEIIVQIQKALAAVFAMKISS